MSSRFMVVLHLRVESKLMQQPISEVLTNTKWKIFFKRQVQKVGKPSILSPESLGYETRQKPWTSVTFAELTTCV